MYTPKQDQEVKFTVNLPLDEYGRPGGMYSLADLPIVRHGDVVLEGKVTAMDSERGVYQVEDVSGREYVVYPDAIDWLGDTLAELDKVTSPLRGQPTKHTKEPHPYTWLR